MIDVRELTRADFAAVDAELPLHRFDGWHEDATYLIAWDGDTPVGHVHVAWSGTELGFPELQDFFVPAARRGRGVGTALAASAEQRARARGHDRVSLSVGQENDAARRLYERLGYVEADHPRKRVHGTITIRGGRLEVDDVLVYFVKQLRP